MAGHSEGGAFRGRGIQWAGDSEGMAFQSTGHSEHGAFRARGIQSAGHS